MKILIWDDFPKTNTGGPSGYIYNVYEHLKKHPNNQITFLSQLKDSLEKINNNQSEKKYVNKQLHNNDTTQIQNLYKYLDNSNNKIIKLSLTVYHFCILAAFLRTFFATVEIFCRLYFVHFRSLTRNTPHFFEVLPRGNPGIGPKRAGKRGNNLKNAAS